MIEARGHPYNPSQFLVDNLKLLPKGRVLDVAMGNGRNSIYLAEEGFEVEGIDISAEAVNQALKAGVKAGAKIKATVADLEGNYELEQEAFDVIICFNYLQRSLVPKIKQGVSAGGMVVYETYIVDQPRFGRPKNPDYLLRHNELLDMFRDFRCIRYREGIIEDRKAVAGIVAQKYPISTKL